MSKRILPANRLSAKQSALALGLSVDYFGNCNKIVYRFCRLHGKGALMSGYMKYIDYVDRLLEKFDKIYEDNPQTYLLAKRLFHLDISNTLGSLNALLNQIRGNRTNKIKTIKAIKKIIKYLYIETRYKIVNELFTKDDICIGRMYDYLMGRDLVNKDGTPNKKGLEYMEVKGEDIIIFDVSRLAICN